MWCWGCCGLYPALLSEGELPSEGNPVPTVLQPFFCEGKQTLLRGDPLLSPPAPHVLVNHVICFPRCV